MCLVRFFHPAGHHPAIIAKSDEDFPNFKNLKFSVKIRVIQKNFKKEFYTH